jgi:hypothetical protein
MGAIECKLPKPIVGIVIPRARHSAKKRAKKGYFTVYRVLKGCVKHYTVCARTLPSVRPSDIFPKRLGVSLGTSHRRGGNAEQL